MEFYRALQNLIEVTKRRDKERNEYQGYDWGYHGYHIEKELEEAEEVFEKALDERIENVVKKILNNE